MFWRTCTRINFRWHRADGTLVVTCRQIADAHPERRIRLCIDNAVIFGLH
ncbi:hypothetical protein [Microbulbifer halophilus]